MGNEKGEGGFGVVRTADVDKYIPFKKQIDGMAPKVAEDFGKWYHEKSKNFK